MLKNNFNRQLTAFLSIILASILLYPLTQAGLVTITWFVLGLVILAATLIIMTK